MTIKDDYNNEVTSLTTKISANPRTAAIIIIVLVVIVGALVIKALI